ncbi:MAG TPA: VWA domain-containing protein, partial [Nocardioidaceae bacterium]
FGRRGMARGAVVVVISDGWERADPALLGEQMARLHRLAHRVVWVNPRSAAEQYEPLAGGMAAALPYVDVFVSGHSLDALDDVLAAIRGEADER